MLKEILSTDIGSSTGKTKYSHLWDVIYGDQEYIIEVFPADKIDKADIGEYLEKEIDEKGNIWVLKNKEVKKVKRGRKSKKNV